MIVYIFSCYDRSNNGKIPKETMYLVCSLAPDLSRKQCSYILHRTIIPGNPDKLKTNAMKYQAMKTKWSAITFAQHFFWYNMFEDGLNKIFYLSIGECNLKGKTFGELIWNFIVNGDKTCMHASSRNLHVISSKDRNKHENILHNSCCSIPMYCTGSIAGNTGPTDFFMEG